MAKELKSIFTDNMGRCLVTGMETDVEIHHIFSGTDRPKSELFNFCVPLHASVHVNGSRLDMKTPWVDLDHWLKRKCQEYFIEVAQMGDRDDWYRLFGKKVWMNGRWEWDLRKEKK